MSYILYNNETKRYFAGITPSEGKNNCIVTSNLKNHARVFDKKKDASKILDFLKNGGHPSFEIIEIK